MSHERLIAIRTVPQNESQIADLVKAIQDLPGIDQVVQRPLGEVRLERDEYYSIANVIKRQRLIVGITQADLASRAGLSRGHINKLEKGKANIRTNNLVRVMRELGFDSDSDEVKAAIKANAGNQVGSMRGL